jgi:GNAT superfamily N-acetyltransferase
MLQVFKRHRMEINLAETSLPGAVLPAGYAWRSWSPDLLSNHARVIWESFRDEMDHLLFPALGTYSGCEDLMRSIARHSRFLPQATWLAERVDEATGSREECGSIQGLAQNSTTGMIQNLGVLPAWRRQGLGRSLLLKALRGFRSHGLCRVSLEVTDDNQEAMQLYLSVGFQCVSTVCKTAPGPLQSLGE